jgi:DNA-binding NtrC family response regulator
MNYRPSLTLADVERAYVLKVLNRCGGNRTAAARWLGISVRGLRDKLHAYADGGFEIPRPQSGIAHEGPQLECRS